MDGFLPVVEFLQKFLLFGLVGCGMVVSLGQIFGKVVKFDRTGLVKLDEFPVAVADCRAGSPCGAMVMGVMPEERTCGLGRTATQQFCKADSVDMLTRQRGEVRQFEECRIKITGNERGLANRSGLRYGCSPDDQWNTYAAFIEPALAGAQRRVAGGASVLQG